MKERPILFSAPMVRALLDGSKTQTRRPITGPRYGLKVNKHPAEPSILADRVEEGPEGFMFRGGVLQVGPIACPYGKPGERLWVREAWADLEQLSDGNYQRQAIYRADDIEQYGDEDEPVNVTAPGMRWRPSIHMPRWASRILLEIVSVRVERLQAISDADAIAEGCSGYRPDDDPFHDVEPRDEYRELWEQINGAGSWDANPWVWVVEFRLIEPERGTP